MDASKIHPKFANEKVCKNPRCGGYFLSEVPKDYCPTCEERGVTPLPTKDILYKEINTEKLQARITELERKVEILEKTTLRKANRVESRTFEDKKCTNCGKDFTPTAPNQQICVGCREILTN